MEDGQKLKKNLKASQNQLKQLDVLDFGIFW